MIRKTKAGHVLKDPLKEKQKGTAATTLMKESANAHKKMYLQEARDIDRFVKNKKKK